jgi:hypothetical protein
MARPGKRRNHGPLTPPLRADLMPFICKESIMTQPIALITGGARGIGYACAEALKAEGHRIVLADI